MRSPLGGLIFVAILVLLDSYVFQAVKTITLSAAPKTRVLVYSIYWGITILVIVGFLLFAFTSQNLLPKIVRTYLFAIVDRKSVV